MSELKILHHIREFSYLRLKELLGVFKETVSEWVNDKAPRLGASLAFYTLLSLAPLLIFAGRRAESSVQATPRAFARMVVSDGVRWTTLGVIVGIAASASLLRLLKGLRNEGPGPQGVCWWHRDSCCSGYSA